MKKILSVLCLMATFTLSAKAPAELGSQLERYSYTMGAKLGALLRNQGVQALDGKAFTAGIEDILGGREPQLSQVQMNQAIIDQQTAENARRDAAAQSNIEDGAAFRERYAKQDGVVTTASGLLYRELRAGTGRTPTASDRVRVHYRGTLISGEEFDSSHARGKPAEFALNGVISGFREALSLMKAGGKWEVVIPGDLAYGARGAGSQIGPNATLIFELELLDVL